MTRARTSRGIAALLLAVGMTVSGCGDDTGSVDDLVDGTVADDTVVDDTVTPSEEDAEDARDALAGALESAGLDTVASALDDVDVASLTDAAEFTFFAPNDEAFTALSGDELADLLGDLDQLDDVLGNHIVPERLDAASLAETDQVTAQSGEVLSVAVDADGTISVNGVAVVEADLEAGDGVVHVVDALITTGT